MLNTRNTLIAAAILALGASAWAQGTSSGALKPPAPPMPATAAMPTTPAPATDKMAKKDHDKHATKKTEKQHAAKKKDHAMKQTAHQPAAKAGDKATRPAQ
ncbi:MULTISPECIES: hypothetical protein [Hydrogenophaga]|jgi:hypothetical protein|uniref:Uncharacterized protein n=1 Tax=Hydrogenophaga intermedia TaxID=65786 RepID=A0A1L1PKN2_HYDIT|nr:MULTISPECIES: hypothetical protein [Hydrogenophaga]AOS77738.1 hypothetical protein Q5W_01440 [Hydrogenophaga sp. PBC]TMU75888.1 hypothetical protein FGJ01_08855 [Hydrogenophaga intermedia]CDN90552.1 hypothetical protein BN948_04997 [Hydrogenophaga intermedia]